MIKGYFLLKFPTVAFGSEGMDRLQTFAIGSITFKMGWEILAVMDTGDGWMDG